MSGGYQVCLYFLRQVMVLGKVAFYLLFLFCRYIRDLLCDVAQSGIGCNIGGVFINILAYADDIVLLAPSWRAMQVLLVIHESHAAKIDMSCNDNKTVCMVFQPKHRSQIVSVSFLQLTLCHVRQLI